MKKTLINSDFSESILETPYFPSKSPQNTLKTQRKPEILPEFSDFLANLPNFLRKIEKTHSKECFSEFQSLLKDTFQSKFLWKRIEINEDDQGFLENSPTEDKSPKIPEFSFINKLISCAFIGNIEKKPELLINSLVFPEFLEFLIKVLYPETFHPGKSLETEENINEIHLKSRLFSLILDQILIWPINSWLLSKRSFINLLFQAEAIEKDLKIRLFIEKILRKIMLKFPNSRNLSYLFNNLLDPQRKALEKSIFPLKLLKDLAFLNKLSPFPMKSLIFNEKSSIFIETLQGLKNSEAFSLYFEIRLFSLKNLGFCSFSTKLKSSIFQLKFQRNSSGFSLIISLQAQNHEENLSFSMIFKENSWISMLLSLEKGNLHVFYNGKDEFLKISSKSFFKAFEKPFLLTFGSNKPIKEIPEENLSFNGEIRAFFLIEKYLKNMEEIEDFKEKDCFLTINSFAGVINEGKSLEKSRLFKRNRRLFEEKARNKEKNQQIPEEFRELLENPGFYQIPSSEKPEIKEKNGEKAKTFLEKLLKKNSHAKTKKKPRFYAKNIGVFLLEEGDFLQSFLSIQGFEWLLFLIDFYSEIVTSKLQITFLLEILNKIRGFEETKDFFLRNSPEILVLLIGKFAKKQGFSKEIVELYFDIYEFFKENFDFSLFPGFLLEFELFAGQDFEIQAFFLQKIKLELEKNPKLLTFLKEKPDFLMKIVMNIEGYYLERVSMKSLEFETYKDFFFDILYVILREIDFKSQKNLEILLGIICETKAFKIEYLDLLRRIYLHNGNSIFYGKRSIEIRNNFSNKNDEKKAIFLDKSQGNVLILEKSIGKKPEKTDFFKKSLIFEEILLDFSLKSPFPMEVLEFFLEVFLNNRRNSGFLEGSLSKLLELSERDIEKMRFLNRIQHFSDKILWKMLDLLKESMILGLSIEDMLLTVIIKKLEKEVFENKDGFLQEISTFLNDFPDMKLFFLANRKKTRLLCKLLDFFHGNLKIEAFFKEILEFSLENQRNLGFSIEILAFYENNRYFLYLRDALIEILAEKTQNSIFLDNLIEILQVLSKLMRNIEQTSEIIDKTYILAWKFFAQIENFIENERKSIFLSFFMDFSFEIVQKAMKIEDFIQGFQLFRKILLENLVFLRKKREIKEKLLIFHGFLAKKEETRLFLKENGLLRFLYMNVREILLEAYEKEEILEFYSEIIEKDWVLLEKTKEFEDFFLSLSEKTDFPEENEILNKILDFFFIKSKTFLQKGASLLKSLISSNDSENRRFRKEKKLNFRASLEKDSLMRKSVFLEEIQGFFLIKRRFFLIKRCFFSNKKILFF